MSVTRVMVCSKTAEWVRRKMAALYGGTVVDAVTIGEVEFFFSNADSPALRRHEYVHVLQFRRMGAWRFWVAYAWQTLLHGYQGNRYEVEARAAETDLSAPQDDQ